MHDAFAVIDLENNALEEANNVINLENGQLDRKSQVGRCLYPC